MFFLLRKIKLLIDIKWNWTSLRIKPSDAPVLISIALSSWGEPNDRGKAINLLLTESCFSPNEVCRNIVKALEKVGEKYDQTFHKMLSEGLRKFGKEGEKATLELLESNDVQVRRVAANGIWPYPFRDVKIDTTISHQLTLIAIKDTDEYIRITLARGIIPYIQNNPGLEPLLLEVFETLPTDEKLQMFYSLQRLEEWSDDIARAVEKFVISEEVTKDKILNWIVMKGVLEKGLMKNQIAHHVLENLKDFSEKMNENEKDRIQTNMHLCPLIGELTKHGVDFSPYVQQLAISFKLSKYLNIYVNSPGDYGVICLSCLRKMGPMALEKLKEQPEDPSWKQELDYVYQELCDLE